MNKFGFVKCFSVLAMLMVFSAGHAFGYSGAETRGDIDEAERQVWMVRMFLDTLKLNVTAEEGTFALEQYPAGGEGFYDQRRHAVVSKQEGSIRIDGESLATSHRVEIRASEAIGMAPANRLELLALLGKSAEGQFIGSLSIAAGNEDPAQALFTLTYRFNSDGSVDIEGQDNTGWSFDRDNDEGGIVECHAADGSFTTYDMDSNQACVAPSLTTSQWEEVEQLYRSGVSHEEIAAQYGLSCE